LDSKERLDLNGLILSHSASGVCIITHKIFIVLSPKVDVLVTPRQQCSGKAKSAGKGDVFFFKLSKRHFQIGSRRANYLGNQ